MIIQIANGGKVKQSINHQNLQLIQINWLDFLSGSGKDNVSSNRCNNN